MLTVMFTYAHSASASWPDKGDTLVMLLLRSGRDRCQRCRSAMDKAGYFVIDDQHGTWQFFCIDHLMAALREGLVPLRVVGSKS
jgi:hypothetical protein